MGAHVKHVEIYAKKFLPAIRRSERLGKSCGPRWNASLSIIKTCHAVIRAIILLPVHHHLMEGLTAIYTHVLLLDTVCRHPLLNHRGQHIHRMPHVWPLAGLSYCAVPCQFSNNGDALKCLFCYLESGVNGLHKLVPTRLDSPEPFSQVSLFFLPALIQRCESSYQLHQHHTKAENINFRCDLPSDWQLNQLSNGI